MIPDQIIDALLLSPIVIAFGFLGWFATQYIKYEILEKRKQKKIDKNWG